VSEERREKVSQQLLFILRDTQTGQEYPVPPGSLRIGRISENDVVLNDEKVSCDHATLWAQDDQLYIRDENSANSTWVNDERITAPRVLQAGDRVRVGYTVFEVATGAAPPLAVEAAAPAQAALPVVPIAVAGGIVLVILIALMLRAIGGATVPPTATSIATATVPATEEPSSVATATGQPTHTPVGTPTRVPTQPPADTAVPQAAQPELMVPAQGGEYSNPITFEWSGSLSAGQAYQVTAYHLESAYTVQSELLMTQNWITDLPAERFGEWRWTVSMVQGGQTVTTSSEWMFWFQPFPGTRQSPQPTDTPASGSRP